MLFPALRDFFFDFLCDQKSSFDFVLVHCSFCSLQKITICIVSKTRTRNAALEHVSKRFFTFDDSYDCTFQLPRIVQWLEQSACIGIESLITHSCSVFKSLSSIS